MCLFQFWFPPCVCPEVGLLGHKVKSLILTYVPKHEPPSHLPPHNISLGHPHAPAPSMLYPESDIDWRFNSYMIVYMLECHSPKLSHPLPLPLSPKVCVFLLDSSKCSIPGLVGKTPWRSERLATPVIWPGEFHGLYSP